MKGDGEQGTHHWDRGRRILVAEAARGSKKGPSRDKIETDLTGLAGYLLVTLYFKPVGYEGGEWKSVASAPGGRYEDGRGRVRDHAPPTFGAGYLAAASLELYLTGIVPVDSDAVLVAAACSVSR